MNREYILPAAVVAWFLLLALAEVIAARRFAKSQRTTDRRLLANFRLTALVILCGTLFPVAGAAIISERLGIGLAQSVALPAALVFVVTLIAQTFAAYWSHRMMHALPLLWRIHRVHHSDGAVDVSTSFRNHPFELLFTTPPAMLAILIVGPPIEIVAVTQTLLSAAAIWEHADIPLPARIERMLASIIVTPRLHRLHHSPERQIHDRNFGVMLILWDRLFGTFDGRMGRGRVGLDGEPIRPDHLLDQLCSPLRGARTRTSAAS